MGNLKYQNSLRQIRLVVVRGEVSWGGINEGGQKVQMEENK